MADGAIRHVDSRIEIPVQDFLIQRKSRVPFRPVADQEIRARRELLFALYRHARIRAFKPDLEVEIVKLKHRGIGEEAGAKVRRFNEITDGWGRDTEIRNEKGRERTSHFRMLLSIRQHGGEQQDSGLIPHLLLLRISA